MTTPRETAVNKGLHATSLSFPKALLPDRVTILAYGALLSESSSRLTFPELEDFRHVRIRNMRRIFGHPHLFLIKQKLVDPTQTLRLASLSAEPSDGYSFVAASFTVQLDDTQRANFVAREPEYHIVSTPFYNLDDDATAQPAGIGVICTASLDERLSISPPTNMPVASIWHWPHESGLLPADIYLRHCLLAVQKASGQAEKSFLEDSYMVDRTTTLAKYLETNRSQVMASRPPQELTTRFGG